MAPRVETEKLREKPGWGAARARRVAGGLGVRRRQGREREEKRVERERKRYLTDSNSNFSQKFFCNLENFEYESCREFKSLQLLFQEKVYSSKGLKVI